MAHICRLAMVVLHDGSLFQIEAAFGQTRQALNLLLLKEIATLLQQRDRELPRPSCPRCGRTMHVNRPEPLTLQFQEGAVEIVRNYCECRSCKLYRYPLDEELGLLATGECAPAFSHNLCLIGAELPSSAGCRLLRALTGREISEGLIKAQIRRDGDALVELERQEADRLWPYTEKGRWKQIKGDWDRRLHNPPPPGGTVIIEMDGVMGNLGNDRDIREEIEEWERQMRRQGKKPMEDELPPSTWREIRVMRIFRQEDVSVSVSRNGKERRSVTRGETIAVVNDPLFFNKRVNAVSQAWGIDRYSQRVTICDGAPHLWEISSTLINPTIEILDVRHAQSHIYECGKALFEGKDARSWARKWCRSLRKQGPRNLSRALQRLAEKTWKPDAERVLTNLIDYVSTHYKRMQYPKYRAAGLPIASGAIESANRQVVSDRCKRAGMRWTRAGLQRIVSLRCALLSDNWEIVCRAIREHRACTATRRRRRHKPLTNRNIAEEAVSPIKQCPKKGPATPGQRSPGSARVTTALSNRTRPAIPPRKLQKLIDSGLYRFEGEELVLAAAG